MNSTTLIIIVILVIILIPAIRSTLTHMKGEGDCCGGPKEKPISKKIDGTVNKEYIIGIDGMHCVNCKNSIERHLDEIPDVVAKVNLNQKTASVLVYGQTDIDTIKAKVESLDFTVTSITEK